MIFYNYVVLSDFLRPALYVWFTLDKLVKKVNTLDTELDVFIEVKVTTSRVRM